MRCISLWQPWATLVAIGAKHVETRHWSTNYTGPLLIHASRHWDRGLNGMCSDTLFYEVLQPHYPQVRCLGDPDYRRVLHFGAVIGVCRLVRCHRVEDLEFIGRDGAAVLTPDERAFGDFSPGRFGWLLSDPMLFDLPFPFRGHQSFFDVPDQFVEGKLHSWLKGA